MKKLVVASLALFLMSLASPASAYVVEVTTSVSLAGVEDTTQLKRAVQLAVDGVLKDVIAFAPTMMALTDARISGDRLYLRLLIADHDGEQTIGELSAGPNPSPSGVERPDDLRM